MLKLTEKRPVWKDVLPGVRVQFAPVTNKSWRAARRAAAAVLGRAEADATDQELREEAGDAFSLALISGAIVAWEGVGDADGNPVPPSAETIRLFLADPRRFEACDNAYVLPIVLEQEEGNAFAGSPSGTSVEATPAKTIAASPAKPRRASDAKSARTGSRTHKPKKA